MKELRVKIFAIPLNVMVKNGIFDYDPSLPGVAPQNFQMVEDIESGLYSIETEFEGDVRRGKWVVTSAHAASQDELVVSLCETITNILAEEPIDPEDTEEPLED